MNTLILLSFIAGLFGMGFLVSQIQLAKKRHQLRSFDKLLQNASEVIEELDNHGVRPAPTCDFCGERSVDQTIFQELLKQASDKHVLSCPTALAKIPAYEMTLSKERSDREYVKSIPVEVAIERHKTIAEEARAVGARSFAELYATANTKKTKS